MVPKIPGAATSLRTNFVIVLLTLVFILFEAAGFPSKLQTAFGQRTRVNRFAAVLQQVQRFLAIEALTSPMAGVLIGAWAGSMVLSGLAVADFLPQADDLMPRFRFSLLAANRRVAKLQGPRAFRAGSACGLDH